MPLIQPHGGTLVNRLAPESKLASLRDEAKTLPRLNLTLKQSCDLEMITIGAFSPLTGFMGKADFENVCRNMRLASGPNGGHIWSIPILLAVKKDQAPGVGKRLALYAPSGALQAIMTVTELLAAVHGINRQPLPEAAAEFEGVM